MKSQDDMLQYKPEALGKFISMCSNSGDTNILDIGAGKTDKHATIMREHGLNVETADFFPHSTYTGDYNEIVMEKQFDGIWCSHVLEHQLNVNSFLTKIFHDTKDNGIVCVLVPPLKHHIVGGHVTLWNAGLLLYNLVLAGFDCSKAKVKTHGYNISVIVKKKGFECPPLAYDTPDIQTALKPYFPLTWSGRSFDGQIADINWGGC